MLKQGPDFSVQDKQLFEISGPDVRVDCKIYLSVILISNHYVSNGKVQKARSVDRNINQHLDDNFSTYISHPLKRCLFTSTS